MHLSQVIVFQDFELLLSFKLLEDHQDEPPVREVLQASVSGGEAEHSGQVLAQKLFPVHQLQHFPQPQDLQGLQ